MMYTKSERKQMFYLHCFKRYQKGQKSWNHKKLQGQKLSIRT